MNKEIKDIELTTKNDEDTKNHQAFSMELSRINMGKEKCGKQKYCTTYTQTDEKRYFEIEPLVRRTQEINYNKKKVAMDAGSENEFQAPKNGTEVNIAKITKSSDHSGPSVTNKIMSNNQAQKSKKGTNILTNAQALSEELSKIIYLIEYMNNNNKQKL